MVRGNSQGAKGSVEKAEFALRGILAESAYLQKKVLAHECYVIICWLQVEARYLCLDIARKRTKLQLQPESLQPMACLKLGKAAAT